MAKKNVVWMIKAYEDLYYLYAGEKPRFIVDDCGYLRPDPYRRQVCVSKPCCKLLGLPAMKKGAPPVCITFTVKPVPKAKKLPAKKAAKKRSK